MATIDPAIDQKKVPTPICLAAAVAWTYGAANRMTSRTTDGVTVSFTYDAAGNQLTAQGPAGTITSTYDRLGS